MKEVIIVILSVLAISVVLFFVCQRFAVKCNPANEGLLYSHDRANIDVCRNGQWIPARMK